MTVYTDIVATFDADSFGFIHGGKMLGKTREVIGRCAITASAEAASIASIYGSAIKVPWTAILIPGRSVIANEALGSSVTVALGLAAPAAGGGLGTIVDNDCIMAATDFAAAGTRTLLDTVAKHGSAANWGAPLWQLAGLTAAPSDKGMYPDWQFLTAGATTAAAIRAICFSLAFSLPQG